MNDTTVAEPAKLSEMLDARRKSPPFFIRLTGDNGFEIMLGIGGDLGCVHIVEVMASRRI